MSITPYNIPLWRKTRSGPNHLRYCNIQFVAQLCVQPENGLQGRNMLLMVNNGGMDWIELVQDGDRWRALVNAVMNLWVT